jgi:hypothetical protein
MTLRHGLILLCAFALRAMAQGDTTWVVYQAGMDLRDGLYADVSALRYNTPTVPIDRLRDDQGARVGDIRTRIGNLFWQPDTGGRQAIDLDRIWGFCQNDVVYVRAGDGFYRIGLMGSLSHLVYQQSYRDWDPFLYGYGTVTRTVMEQQLIDMATGAMLPFNASGVERALRNDPVLHEEFMALPAKQRNSAEAQFRFLRLYNQLHPLRFPQW